MIHPTATIEQGAVIAENATIGPFCHIAKDAVIESQAILDPHVTVHGGVTVGRGTHLYAFVVLGNGKALLNIGAECHIREFAHILTESSAKERVVIAERCYIMAYSQICSGVILESGCTITNNTILSPGSRCDSSVIVGAKATIDAGCTVGTGTMVGAVSAVKSDMPPYTLVEGYPTAKIRGLNLVGMRRKFQSRESINAVKHLFHQLKKADFDPQLAAKLQQETEDPHAKTLASFVATHKVQAS